MRLLFKNLRIKAKIAANGELLGRFLTQILTFLDSKITIMNTAVP